MELNFKKKLRVGRIILFVTLLLIIGVAWSMVFTKELVYNFQNYVILAFCLGVLILVLNLYFLSNVSKRFNIYKKETKRFKEKLKKCKTQKEVVQLILVYIPSFGCCGHEIEDWRPIVLEKYKDLKRKEKTMVDLFYGEILAKSFEIEDESVKREIDNALIEDLFEVFSEEFPTSKRCLELKCYSERVFNAKLKALSDSELVNRALLYPNVFYPTIASRLKEDGRILKNIAFIWNSLNRNSDKAKRFDKAICQAIKELGRKADYKFLFQELEKMFNKNTRTGIWLRWEKF